MGYNDRICILVFDKGGQVAYVEVKSTASHPHKWLLQKKYATPSGDAISQARRFICCVDLTPKDREPDIYVFPSAIVSDALHYFYSSRFSRSPSYVLALNSKPRGRTRDASCVTVGEHIGHERYLDRFDGLGVASVSR
jgi:hypothetical protein